MVFNMHVQRFAGRVEAPVIDHVHRVKGRNVKGFLQRARLLAVHRVVMTLIPRRVAHFGQHPAQGVGFVIAVVKIDRIKMEAEVAQLGQEHHAARRAAAGQALQPVQHLGLQRRAQRIIGVVPGGGGQAVAADARLRQLVQFVEVEPGHKQAVDEVVRLRLQATVAQDALIEAAVHFSGPPPRRCPAPRRARCAPHPHESRCTSRPRSTSSAAGR